MGNAEMEQTAPVDTTDVVIVGSGFGALATAKKLGKAGVPFVLISDTTEHLFQPLLYQVATGILSAAEIAPPTRSILAKYDSADVRLGRVVDVRPETREVDYVADGAVRTIGYKSLVAATGARQSYFGNDHFAKVTFALKTVDDAENLRRQILRCFEQADTTLDADRRKELLSFVVVGAGPTGVELAGQIRELAQRYVDQAFHRIDADDVSVKLIEGADKVLPPFGGKLSEYSKNALEKNGVEVVLDTFVTDIDDHGVTVKSKTDGEKHITAETVIWSAGVQANDFAGVLAERTGCATDRAGRLLVNPDLTVGGFADVFAIGDMTNLDNLPGQSPVAMQEGRFVAKTILGKIQRGTAFEYFDKGSMAIVNRFRAITKVRSIELTGIIAWLTWLAVHVYYVVGFRNRAVTILSWFESFLGHQRPHFHMQQDETPLHLRSQEDESRPEAA